MQDYRKLLVWDKAHALVLIIYNETKVYPKEELFGLTSQIRRSAISIPANIAEGCGRYSNKDSCHFFQIALGSLHETDYLLLSKDLGYIKEETYETINKQISEVKAMLIGLIKRIKNTVSANL